jgi:general stress protein 26
MKQESGNSDKLKAKFWTELMDSPLLFLQLDGSPDSAVPMRAHLDKDADSAIWFYVASDSHLARIGPATATFASKDHDLFARFHGILARETSPERRKKHWGNHVEAWFPKGQDSDAVTMLRLDLGPAEIWDHNLGLLTAAKMALGMAVRGKAIHTETTL